MWDSRGGLGYERSRTGELLLRHRRGALELAGGWAWPEDWPLCGLRAELWTGASSASSPVTLLGSHIGFNSWQAAVWPDFRTLGGLNTGSEPNTWLHKINLAELTPVQLNLFAALLLCLALALAVSVDDPLVVDIRLHPGLPAICRDEWWVVKRAGGWFLGRRHTGLVPILLQAVMEFR